MTIRNVLCHEVRFDSRVANTTLHLQIKEAPLEPIPLGFDGVWEREDVDWRGSTCSLRQAGTCVFFKCD